MSQHLNNEVVKTSRGELKSDKYVIWLEKGAFTFDIPKTMI